MIGSTSYYEPSSEESGKIEFCLLVEYRYASTNFRQKEVVMNFRHVGVVANVDLTADFSLEDIETIVSHNEVWTELDHDYTINAVKNKNC